MGFFDFITDLFGGGGSAAGGPSVPVPGTGGGGGPPPPGPAPVPTPGDFLPPGGGPGAPDLSDPGGGLGPPGEIGPPIQFAPGEAVRRGEVDQDTGEFTITDLETGAVTTGTTIGGAVGGALASQAKAKREQEQAQEAFASLQGILDFTVPIGGVGPVFSEVPLAVPAQYAGIVSPAALNVSTSRQLDAAAIEELCYAQLRTGTFLIDPRACGRRR